MTTSVGGSVQLRRFGQPEYELDQPDDLQAWATYYAQGGTDTASTAYSTLMPDPIANADQANDIASLIRPPLSIDTDIPGEKSTQVDNKDLEYLQRRYGNVYVHPTEDIPVKYDFEPSRPDELAVKGGARVSIIYSFKDQWSLVKDEEGKRGMVPSDCLNLGDSSESLKVPGAGTSSSKSSSQVQFPTSQNSKKKPKKGVLGLLELLHITRRKQKGDPKLAQSTRTSSERRPRSVLKNSSSASGHKESESPKRVRFDSTEKLQLGAPSDAVRLDEPPSLINFEENQSDIPGFSPPLPPPSYEEVFPRRLLPQTPSEKSTPSPTLSFRNSLQAHHSGSSGEKGPSSTDVPPSLLANEVSVVPDEESTVSHRFIYQNLLSVLVGEVSLTAILRATLHEYLVSLQSLDPVASLVQSRDYRANLLQVALALNISEEQSIREALQKDEDEIAGILDAVSQSDTYRTEVLALEGDNAQKFLDVVQDVLDKAYLLNHKDNARARRLLIRLSETCDKLPSSLFINGVERSDDQATYGGGFGDVYRAMYNGQRVALKRMRMLHGDPRLPNIRRRFCKEALIWQQLKSTFIVPFLGIDAETFSSSLCMVSPWMRNGTVLKHLADHGRVGVNKRLYEVAQGLAYLHSQKIVHGDLRGSNILINDQWQACLTDFGLTVFDDANTVNFTSRREGSVRWMAPELHTPESFGLDKSHPTQETDIYAFGCVCLELYTGHAPFADVHRDPAVMFKVIQGGRPDRPTGESEMSDQLWKMVEMCWSQHFADRLKIEEVVEFTRKLSDPNTKTLDLPVFSEVPESFLPSNHEEWDDLYREASEVALVHSQDNAPYLQLELSFSKDSLFSKFLPSSSRNSLLPPSSRPSSLLPVPRTLQDNSPVVYSSEEEDGDDDDDDTRSEYEMVMLPRLPIRDSSLPKPSLSEDLEHRWDIIQQLAAIDLNFNMEDCWSIVRELDEALDMNFSL